MYTVFTSIFQLFNKVGLSLTALLRAMNTNEITSKTIHAATFAHGSHVSRIRQHELGTSSIYMYVCVYIYIYIYIYSNLIMFACNSLHVLCCFELCQCDQRTCICTSACMFVNGHAKGV